MTDPDHVLHDRTEGACGSLTSDEVGALRAAKLAKSAVAAVTQAELQAEIRLLHPRTLALIRQALKARRNAPPAVYAQALLTRLAQAPEDTATDILHDVLPHVVTLTCLTEHLDHLELASLLSGNPDELGFLTGSELLAELLNQRGTARARSIYAAGWASMAGSGHAGSTAALAWLVANPPEVWTKEQLSLVEAVWSRVRERVPGLPARPAPFHHLCEAVEELHAAGAFADREELGDPSLAPVERAAELIAGQSAVEIPLETLISRREEIERTVEAVRGTALPEVAAALAAGRVPEPDQIARLLDMINSMTAFFADVALATGGEPPQSLEQAGSLISELADARASAGALDRLRTLTTLNAPDYVAAEAAMVAQLAGEVDATSDAKLLAALDALLTMIELAGSDPQRGTELLKVIQAGLPSAMPLVMPASTGGLRLGTSPGEALPTATPADQLGDGTEDTEVTQDAEQPEDMPAARDETTTALSLDLEAVIADMAFTVPTPAPPSPAEANPDDAPAAADVSAAPAVDLVTSDVNLPPEHGDMLSRLISARQFALAAWLSDALDRRDADGAVFRLAAHALAICSSLDSNATAFADIAKDLDAEQLEDRIDLQLLVYAAGVRAGLLSPVTNAATLLREVTPNVLKTGPAVEELTDALLTAFYSGAHLTPQSADAVAEAAGAEAEHERLTAAAQTMLRTSQSRTIRYVAATELWQRWTSTTGYLGEHLAIAASGSRSAESARRVRAHVAELRSRANVEAALDRDSMKLQSTRNRPRRIEARARDKLLAWTSEVADLLARWVTVTDNLNRPAAGTWMADPIAELRQTVADRRSQAIEQLTRLIGGQTATQRATIGVGLALLTESLDLLDGADEVDKVEMPAQYVISGQLALATDLPLDATAAPQRPVTADDVAAVAAALGSEDVGWTEAFNARLARHDHVGAQVLVETLRSRQPSLAQRLSTERDRAVSRSAEKLDDKLTELLRRIDSDRRFGRLNPDQWTDLSSHARGYDKTARGTRRDFDKMLSDLDEIEARRAKAVAATCETALAALADLDIEQGDRDRIRSCIDQGDITTAHEFTETLRSGHGLPAPKPDPQHLTRFHPAFPELFSAADSDGRRTGLDLLRTLVDMIKAGRPLAGSALSTLLAEAGIDVSAIRRPTAAAPRLEKWIALTEAASLARQPNHVKAILEQLGFFVERVELKDKPAGKARRSSWAQLVGVRPTSGKALIPAFGSRMSPSGDSLRLLAVWNSPTPQELVELLRSEPVDQSVVVLYFGALSPAARRELATLFHRGRKLPAAAVIDHAAFSYLAVQPEAGRDITMSITLPFTTAYPFTPDVAGLVSPEMFYGRTEERDKVVDMMGPCIVYGGRQLGKSALLRAAAREFDNRPLRYAIYQSIFKVGQSHPVEAVWPLLWESLTKKEVLTDPIPTDNVAAALIAAIEGWIRETPGRQLLLLLDESDFFLDGDAADGRFTHVTQFKELMESTDRAVKVVFAGLHKTARFERLANHPLAHFGDPVCVGPLAPQPAYDLLTQPLRALGYHFEEDDEQAARVIALANNQPALIQLFGDQLLRNLYKAPLAATAPPHMVTKSDVSAVWSDNALRTSFRKRFEWTLNLDPRYKIIAYSVAFHAHTSGIGSTLTAAQLRADCEQWWPQGFAAEAVRTGEFHALLDECVDLGVLSYTKGGYRLRTPNILDLLGSVDDVDEVLGQAESTPLPESFDGSLMRPPFLATPTRGPLTSRQIADLLAQRSQVRLIAGSDALTVQRCARTLQKEAGAQARLIESTIPQLRKTCGNAPLQAAGQHAVIVVNVPDSAKPQDVLTAWQQAREVIAAHSVGTLGIVIITSPAHAAAWPTAEHQADASSSVISLRRYGDTDLRLWLNDSALPFQDDASRGDLLAVTGGWPMLINWLAEQLTDHPEPPNGDPLGRIRSYLDAPDCADGLVTASGVRADEVLSQAWSLLCDHYADDMTDAATFADYLKMHAEDDEPGAQALKESRLRESGYRDTNGVVGVLATLGVLATAEDGLLRVEPVLAKATASAAGRSKDQLRAGR
ncbi:hypothetical protein [Actinokineospora sp. NPDC004072]